MPADSRVWTVWGVPSMAESMIIMGSIMANIIMPPNISWADLSYLDQAASYMAKACRAFSAVYEGTSPTADCFAIYPATKSRSMVTGWCLE